MTADKIWSYGHASLRDTWRKHNQQICSLGLKKLLVTVDNKNIDFNYWLTLRTVFDGLPTKNNGFTDLSTIATLAQAH